MNFIYLVSMLMSFILLITAVARLNDLGRPTLEWHRLMRTVGMILVACSCLFIIASPLAGYQVTMVDAVMLLGFTFSWITTPSQPPWWNYITKGEANSCQLKRKNDKKGDSHA